jgi:hypothetical protein
MSSTVPRRTIDCVHTATRGHNGLSHGPVAAYLAAGWAALFAAVSVYWAAGGTVGLASVGGDIAGLAQSDSMGATVLAWGAAALKIAGVVFALALVSRWKRVFPRRLVLVAGWTAAIILVVYGAVNVVGELLVVLHLVATPSGADLTALHWHLVLWDPYFVVWGLLLGAAVRRYTRAG